jgi:hypothetical protein
VDPRDGAENRREIRPDTVILYAFGCPVDEEDGEDTREQNGVEHAGTAARVGVVDAEMLRPEVSNEGLAHEGAAGTGSSKCRKTRVDEVPEHWRCECHLVENGEELVVCQQRFS